MKAYIIHKLSSDSWITLRAVILALIFLESDVVALEEENNVSFF